jgi:uncharacterized protein YjbJ (UPF0337 family)
MNKDRVSGSIDQIIGKSKVALGDAAGSDSFAREGAVQQLKGDAKQIWGEVKDTADELVADTKSIVGHSEALAAVEHQDLRAKVLRTAQKFTDEITGKLDDFNQKQAARRDKKRKPL